VSDVISWNRDFLGHPSCILLSLILISISGAQILQHVSNYVKHGVMWRLLLLSCLSWRQADFISRKLNHMWSLHKGLRGHCMLVTKCITK